jgi:tRNA G18 (ribose-2'-O)-methylase SpoU
MKRVDPLLFAGLRERDLAKEGIVVAEGRLVTERLLAAPGFEVLGLRCVPALFDRFANLAAGRFPVDALTEIELSGLLGYPFHRGVLAIALRPPALDADVLLESIAPDKPSSVLLLPETRDPENLGALIRSAAVFGLDAILAGPGTADQLSRRVLRVSMGAALSARFARLREPGGLEAWKERGFVIDAAVVDPRAPDVDEWRPAPRVMLALGEEYSGLAPDWLRRTEGRVTIRMAPGPDSLNVAAAGAILMRRLSLRLVSRGAKG